MVEGGRYGHEEKAHHWARNRFWEARVARILRICNLLHKSNGEGSHGSVEVYLDLFLGSSSPYSYTFGSLTLPPDVPAHTCATKQRSVPASAKNSGKTWKGCGRAASKTSSKSNFGEGCSAEISEVRNVRKGRARLCKAMQGYARLARLAFVGEVKAWRSR